MKKTLKKHKLVAALALVVGALFLPGTSVRKAAAAEGEITLRISTKDYKNGDVYELDQDSIIIGISDDPSSGPGVYRIYTDDQKPIYDNNPIYEDPSDPNSEIIGYTENIIGYEKPKVVTPNINTLDILVSGKTITLKREGPGFATLQLWRIPKDASGNLLEDEAENIVSLGVKVEYSVKNGLLVMDTNEKKRFDLEYAKNPEPIPETRYGNLVWTSKNDFVAAVDRNGEVTAKGAGVAGITIEVHAGDNGWRVPAKVVVLPKGSFTYHEDYDKYERKLSNDGIEYLDSAFDEYFDPDNSKYGDLTLGGKDKALYTTSEKGFRIYLNTESIEESGLYVEVYKLRDRDGVDKVPVDKSLYKFVDDYILFKEGIEVGTYFIYVYPSEDYKNDSSMRFEAKVYVELQDKTLLLGEGDSYNVFEGSNIPKDATQDVFPEYPELEPNTQETRNAVSAAPLGGGNYLFKVKDMSYSSSITYKLKYNKDCGLFDRLYEARYSRCNGSKAIIDIINKYTIWIIDNFYAYNVIELNVGDEIPYEKLGTRRYLYDGKNIDPDIPIEGLIWPKEVDCDAIELKDQKVVAVRECKDNEYATVEVSMKTGKGILRTATFKFHVNPKAETPPEPPKVTKIEIKLMDATNPKKEQDYILLGDPEKVPYQYKEYVIEMDEDEEGEESKLYYPLRANVFIDGKEVPDYEIPVTFRILGDAVQEVPGSKSDQAMQIKPMKRGSVEILALDEHNQEIGSIVIRVTAPVYPVYIEEFEVFEIDDKGKTKKTKGDKISGEENTKKDLVAEIVKPDPEEQEVDNKDFIWELDGDFSEWVKIDQEYGIAYVYFLKYDKDAPTIPLIVKPAKGDAAKQTFYIEVKQSSKKEVDSIDLNVFKYGYEEHEKDRKLTPDSDGVIEISLLEVDPPLDIYTVIATTNPDSEVPVEFTIVGDAVELVESRKGDHYMDFRPKQAGYAVIVATNKHNQKYGSVRIRVVKPEKPEDSVKVENIDIFYIFNEDDRYNADKDKDTVKDNIIEKGGYIYGYQGEKKALGAVVEPKEAENKDVVWYIPSKYTDIATVSEYGVVTFLKYDKDRNSVPLFVRSADGGFPKEGEETPYTIIVKEPEVPEDVTSVTLEVYDYDHKKLEYNSEGIIELPLAKTTSPMDVYTVFAYVEAGGVKVPVDFTIDGAAVEFYGTPEKDYAKIRSVKTGYAVVVATNAHNQKYGSIRIRVTEKVPVTEVKASLKELVMNTGDSFKLEATVTPANAEKEDVKWKLWLAEDSQYATVSSNGRVEAKKATPANYPVWLEVSAGNGITDRCKLTIVEPVTGLELSSTKEKIANGQMLKLKAKVLPENANNKNVIWSSMDESVATVDEDGTVTGIHGGLAVIQCETEEDGYVAFCIIEVDEKASDITVSPKQYKLGLGKTYQLKAEIANSGASSKKIEWSSSDTGVATVNQSGEVKGVSLGYATITARATDGSKASDTCEIRVITEVSGMKMKTTTLTLMQGQNYQMEAVISPENATYQTASWESADEKIASVDDSGVVTAISPGSVWITAKARDESGKYCTCLVTVIAPVPSTNITTQMSEVILMPGERKTVVAKSTPANTTDAMTWTSTDDSVARVNAVTGEITAISPGNTSVIVMTDSGKRAVINVIVVGLSRTSVIMDYYSTGPQLYVEGTTDKVRWYSSNRRVVEVSANGTLTSRGAGTATVEARVNGRTLTCTVRVVTP